MFRGEFTGLNNSADFYAKDTDGLKKEGQISLDVFLHMCKEDGVSPKKQCGNFALRLDPETYYEASMAASASGMSLNKRRLTTKHSQYTVKSLNSLAYT